MWKCSSLEHTNKPGRWMHRPTNGPTDRQTGRQTHIQTYGHKAKQMQLPHISSGNLFLPPPPNKQLQTPLCRVFARLLHFGTECLYDICTAHCTS